MTEDTAGNQPLDEPEPTESLDSLALDTVLEVLANRNRRFALYALIEAPDGVMALDTLIENVATLTAALDREAVTRERYLDIATDLYHWQLPVLADVGVVEGDARHEMIRYRRDPVLETWLEQVRGYEIA